MDYLHCFCMPPIVTIKCDMKFRHLILYWLWFVCVTACFKHCTFDGWLWMMKWEDCGKSHCGLFRYVLCVPAIRLILCDTKCQVWHYNRNIHRAVFGSYYTAQLARPCTVLHRTLPSNQNIDRHLGCDARALYRRTAQPIPLGYWCIHARAAVLRLSRLVRSDSVYGCPLIEHRLA